MYKQKLARHTVDDDLDSQVDFFGFERLALSTIQGTQATTEEDTVPK
jgi:hypothetical protein